MRIPGRRTGALLLAALLVSGCPDTEAPKAPPPGQPPAASTPLPRMDGPFFKIRDLLTEEPGSERRSYRLAPLIAELCSSADQRQAFLQDAKRSVELGEGEARALAEDVVEHVATRCWRSDAAVARELLDQVRAAVPELARRSALVRARLHAAEGDFAEALRFAQEARESGSVHAIALVANIQAELSRSEGAGYRPGMLDEAIATVSAEPTGSWPLIDLTAVLSTRAQLYAERAIWEPREEAKASARLALADYQRLSKDPFLSQSQNLASDAWCFLARETGGDLAEACGRAVARDHNLGAAFLLGQVESSSLDRVRLQALTGVAKRIASLPKERVVVVVVRGDESEIIPWVLPASVVLRAIQPRQPAFVLLDRTKTGRAHTLVDRLTELSGIQVQEKIVSESSPFASSCLAAVVTGRRTPQACPLEAARVRQLEKLGERADTAKHPEDNTLAILIGRDLDAEIDDFALYRIPSVLLSVRAPATDRPLEAHLKSRSDVWILAGGAEPRR